MPHPISQHTTDQDASADGSKRAMEGPPRSKQAKTVTFYASISEGRMKVLRKFPGRNSS
jgi:hypothetical protein